MVRCRTTASKKRRMKVKWERRHKTHKPVSLMLMGVVTPNKRRKR